MLFMSTLDWHCLAICPGFLHLKQTMGLETFFQPESTSMGTTSAGLEGMMCWVEGAWKGGLTGFEEEGAIELALSEVPNDLF